MLNYQRVPFTSEISHCHNLSRHPYQPNSIGTGRAGGHVHRGQICEAGQRPLGMSSWGNAHGMFDHVIVPFKKSESI